MVDKNEGKQILYTCKKCGAKYGSKSALPNHLFSKHKVCISAFKKVYDEYIEESYGPFNKIEDDTEDLPKMEQKTDVTQTTENIIEPKYDEENLEDVQFE